MRKLAVSTFLTLDGVMQAPGGPEEDPSNGFDHGGWSVHYWDEVMGQVMDAAMGVPFDLLLGRKTYEIFAAYWPYASEAEGANSLNRATKYVVSTTLQELSWGPALLINRDVPAEIARLKAGDGPELQVHGSGHLIQTLLAHGLIDEFRIWIFPVLLGNGRRLFGEGTLPAGLELLASKVSTTGVVMNVYRPAGPLRIGSFALEQPTESETQRQL